MLSRREFQVTQLFIAGLSQKEIARELGVSVRTIKFHVASSYQKIGIPTFSRSAAKLVLWWAKNGNPETWAEYLQAINRQKDTSKKVVQIRRRSA